MKQISSMPLLSLLLLLLQYINYAATFQTRISTVSFVKQKNTRLYHMPPEMPNSSSSSTAKKAKDDYSFLQQMGMSEEDLKNPNYNDFKRKYIYVDHDKTRKDRITKFEEKVDRWIGDLLGSEEQQAFPLGDVSRQVYEKLMTPVDLDQGIDPRTLDFDDPRYTIFSEHVLPGNPVYPALGCENFGIPTPRARSDPWRHFDVPGMVSTDYSLDPVGRGEELQLAEETKEKYQKQLEKKGYWLDDDDCYARLIYVNGQFVPSLSKTNQCVKHLTPTDFASDEIRPEISECLARLPEGFTDELPSESNQIPMEEVAYTNKFSQLSGPHHSEGKATDQFAINNQHGMAIWAALNSCKTGGVALVDIPNDTDTAKEGCVLLVHAWTKDGGVLDTTDPEQGVASHPRTLVIAGKRSNLRLVQGTIDLYDHEIDLGSDHELSEQEKGEINRPKLYNGHTQLYIREFANVEHSYLDESGGYPTPDVELSVQEDAEDTTLLPLDVSEFTTKKTTFDFWEDDEDDDEELDNEFDLKYDDESILVLAEGELSPQEKESQRPELQNIHFETIDSFLTGMNGTYKHTQLTVGGNGRSRVVLSNMLCQNGTHVEVQGFDLSGGAQRSDIRTTLQHIAPYCTTNQVQKNLVGGRATTYFRGRIRFEQSANWTDSDQIVRTLLLSDEAKIWAIPTQEICAFYARSTHGTTVSDLLGEELFYLMSRGFDKAAARTLLMNAFMREIAQQLDPSIIGRDETLDESQAALVKRLTKRLENITPKGNRAVQSTYSSI